MPFINLYYNLNHSDEPISVETEIKLNFDDSVFETCQGHECPCFESRQKIRATHY
jgi:hypothetical protein